MNIFRLHDDPVLAAIYQCDKHVVKMVLETTQLLETAAAHHGYETTYRSTRVKHPCTLWAQASRVNYDWLVQHGLGLSAEYTYRYGKIHACHGKLLQAQARLVSMPVGIHMDVPQCMPDEFRCQLPVDAYRRYYQHKRTVMSMKWTNRSLPIWMEE